MAKYEKYIYKNGKIEIEVTTENSFFSYDTGILTEKQVDEIVDFLNNIQKRKLKKVNAKLPIMENGKKKYVECPAYRIENTDFILHKGIDGTGLWKISHYPTGLCLNRGGYRTKQNLFNDMCRIYLAYVNNIDKIMESKNIEIVNF